MTVLQYFKTDGIRGKVGVDPITPNFLLTLGSAIGKVLGQNETKTIIIGRDTRISGSMIQSILEFGILSTGVSTLLADCIPTSAIAYFTRSLHASAGIVISGSHNPFCDNGIKLFDRNGIKLSQEIELDIEKKIKKNFLYSNNINFGYSNKIINAENKYIEFCKNIFSKNMNLSKFTIVLDCANGATFNIAPRVFQDLGAKVITTSNIPNGVNINQNSGSTNVFKLKKMVLLEKADIGLAFDGDGDRVIMVDHLGNEIDGDQIIYIIAQEYLRTNQLQGGVVGTLMTNTGVILGLKRLGIPFYAAQDGDRNVYQKIKEKNWILGAEKSGHIILSDKHSTGDGVIASLQVLLIMLDRNVTLHDLCRQIRLLPQVLLNVFFKKHENLEKNLKIRNVLDKYKDILGYNSRVIIRKSGTESCVRIMVEGENYTKVYKLAKYLTKCIN